MKKLVAILFCFVTVISLKGKPLSAKKQAIVKKLLAAQVELADIKKAVLQLKEDIDSINRAFVLITTLEQNAKTINEKSEALKELRVYLAANLLKIVMLPINNYVLLPSENLCNNIETCLQFRDSFMAQVQTNLSNVGGLFEEYVKQGGKIELISDKKAAVIEQISKH